MSEDSVDTDVVETSEEAEATPAGPEPLDVRLQRWGRANGAGNAPIILMLMAALRDGRNLAFWGSVNLLEVLPEPRYMQGTRRLHFVRFLSVLRNSLVFVPVALTWAAISVATTAFGNFTNDNQATTVNFLAFWQDGYGYLSGLWRIGSVALVDVAIVLFIILVTLVIGRIQNSYENAEQRWLDSSEEQRIALAMELQNFFHSRREITSTTVSETIAESVAGLRDMAREMYGAMGELRSAMTALGGAVPQVDQMTHDMLLVSQRSVETLNDLAQSLRDGVGGATEVLNGMSGAVAALGEDATAAAERIVTVERSISTASEDLRNAVAAFTSSADGVRGKMDEGLAAAIDRSAQTIDAIVNEMALTGNSLKTSARTVQDQLEELQRNLNRQNKR